MFFLATKASRLIYAKQERSETWEIQCEANNDNVIADYIIRSSRCKVMGEDNKRYLYIKQPQLKKESIRQPAKNIERNREKEENEDHRIQDGRRWKEAAVCLKY